MNRPKPLARRTFTAIAVAAMALVFSSGCGQGPETSYGLATGFSLNGTGVFAELLRKQGHQVRSAWRLTPELGAWADVIVRFASLPGPPDREEADWYLSWLVNHPGRDLVYVIRDYDGETEYWDLVLKQFTSATDGAVKAEAESRRDRASRWVERLPAAARNPAESSVWFAVDKALGPHTTCKTLGGMWGDDLDPLEVELPLHQPIAAGHEDVLLAGDGHPLAISWRIYHGGNVLVLASGAFLLNLPLAIPARRPLAERTARWIGEKPRRIAFVSGPSPFGEPHLPPSLIEWILDDRTTFWVFLHMALFAVVACLARAPILGRPRGDPPSGVDRPAAHAEALGTLLERGKNADAARELLATYRRWRFPRTPQELAHGPERKPRRS